MGVFAQPYRVNPQRCSRRGTQHGRTDTCMPGGWKKCQYSQIINSITRLHKETMPVQLLHKHGRNAFAASTNMFDLIPCRFCQGELLVHLRSLGGSHTVNFANLFLGQGWSCRQ